MWEESEGTHLYSLACIYSAFDAITEIHSVLKPEYEQNNRLKVEAMNKLENATKKYNQEIKNIFQITYTMKKQKRLQEI